MKSENVKPNRNVVECLDCNESIFVKKNLKIGSFIICEFCDAEFEITSLTPVTIDWPEYDDDYEDDAEFEYADDGYDY